MKTEIIKKKYDEFMNSIDYVKYTHEGLQEILEPSQKMSIWFAIYWKKQNEGGRRKKKVKSFSRNIWEINEKVIINLTIWKKKRKFIHYQLKIL